MHSSNRRPYNSTLDQMIRRPSKRIDATPEEIAAVAANPDVDCKVYRLVADRMGNNVHFHAIPASIGGGVVNERTARRLLTASLRFTGSLGYSVMYRLVGNQWLIVRFERR
tara:strand:- start:49 stop:381 length:333 start_codon:yes stop_codon:yes gene_type:complete